MDRFREGRGGRTFPNDPVMVTEWARVRGAGRRGTPVLSVVTDYGSTQSGSLIDELVREGARRMMAAALGAEVNQYIAELAAQTMDTADCSPSPLRPTHPQPTSTRPAA
ncbi:hypothetical protein GCM10018966_061060 [Streptomyces yanii]